jgi:hypothetical protein
MQKLECKLTSKTIITNVNCMCTGTLEDKTARLFIFYLVHMHTNLAIFIWNFCRLSFHFNMHIFREELLPWGTYIDALWMFKFLFFSSDWNTPFEFVSIFAPKMHHTYFCARHSLRSLMQFSLCRLGCFVPLALVSILL